MQVILPDGRIISYINDPVGRRIAKLVDGVIVEKYLWEGLTRLLAVYDGSDNLIYRFEYADARTPVAMTSGGARYFLGYDQVGSLRVVVDDAGNSVKVIEYDSFGNVIDDTNESFIMPIGFAGGLYDADTGLVRFGYRDFDPETGRWTAKDPIGFLGGDSDLYGYVQNDPVNNVDPHGLNPAIYQFAADFAEGFLVPGPPPPSWAGAAGWWARDRLDAYVDYDAVTDYLSDALIAYLDDDMVYRQFKYQNEMNRMNTPESQFKPGEYYWSSAPKNEYYWAPAPCK